jgi:hypothetical protein
MKAFILGVIVWVVPLTGLGQGPGTSFDTVFLSKGQKAKAGQRIGFLGPELPLDFGISGSRGERDLATGKVCGLQVGISRSQIVNDKGIRLL